jgi:LPXTG-site transpeptidase (sortase) family protein
VTIRPKWAARRPKLAALGAFGALALVAAGGILAGLGPSADAPAGKNPGAAAGRITTGDDPGELQAQQAGREADAPSTTPVEPARLKIPSLDIDAPVLPIAADGLRLVPPSDPQTVGWWSAGALPGAEHGTAILAGHTVSSGGGVFDNLEQMRRGQRVQILSSGPRLSLRVRSVDVLSKEALAERAAEIFDQTARGRVALVTCEDWTGTDYLSNVVVIAAPVD